MRAGDYVSVDRSIADSKDEDEAIQHEWIGAVVFAIAGIALIGSARKPV